MTKKQLIVAILGTAFAVVAHTAELCDVQGIRDKFCSVRPKDADLAIYQLDWVPTLKAAKEKALQEDRPIFLVVVTNSFGDICSGHC